MAVTLSSKSRQRNKSVDADEPFITTSLKRFKITADAESKWRRRAFEDLNFSIGDGQWDESVKANREIEGKPCLVINRSNAFLRQYTGEEKQHRPGMIVSPVGSGADIEVAKIHQGALRHFEAVSNAEYIYDDSYDWMMRIGSKPWRIRVDYINERSFFQEPRIENLDNPFAYFGSPIRKPDGTDPLWAHVVCDYSKEDYIAEFGETTLAQLRFPTEVGNAPPDWVTKHGARVAEYWWIELKDDVLCLLPDGSTKLQSELSEMEKEFVEQKRDTIIRKVHCVKHDAMRILKEYEWRGQYIPFPEVNGLRLNVNGEIYKAGMIRDYRDAQRVYDWMFTKAVEQIDMTSKDPPWVAVGANRNLEDLYRQMNRKNFNWIPWHAFDDQGRPLPKPERLARQSSVDVIQKMIQQADYDMKAVIGIYGPSLGEEAGSSQESGFAIMTRQQQSDTGMIAWHDNLNRSLIWQGKILLDLWPKYINKARIQRIINPDDSVKHAVIYNSQMGDASDAQGMLDKQKGLNKAYAVDVGEFDLTLSTGPMSKTARQETTRILSNIATRNPELLPMFGDVLFKNGDFADADVLAARWKKALPPQFQDDDSTDKDTQLAKAQAELAQLKQVYNQVLVELTRAADTIRTKRIETESKERIALSGQMHDLVMQELKAHDAGALEHLKGMMAAIQGRIDTLHGNMTPEQDAGEPPNTPELPSQVEPKAQPVTPAAPVPRPQPIS